MIVNAVVLVLILMNALLIHEHNDTYKRDNRFSKQWIDDTCCERT